MKKFILKSPFKPNPDQANAIEKLSLELLKKKQEKTNQTLLGVTGSGKTFTMAGVIHKTQMPALIISHNKTLCAQLYQEFKDFFPENRVEYFVSYYDYYQPESYIVSQDLYIEKDAKINDEIDRFRLSATQALASQNDVVIIASVSAIYGIGSPREYEKMALELSTRKELELRICLKNLVQMQYIHNKFSFGPGDFRLTGNTLDIYPPYAKTIIRVEFFGNIIEKIWLLDPISLLKKESQESIYIYPAKHFIMSEENMRLSLRLIEEELHERVEALENEGKIFEAKRLHARTLHDIEMIRESGYCKGIENYSRHIENRNPGSPPFTLLDYFTSDFIVFVDESHVTLSQVHAMYEGDRIRKKNLVDFGFRLPSALDNRPLTYAEFEEKIQNTIFVSATPGDFELKKSKHVIKQIIRPTGLLDPTIEIKPSESQILDILKQVHLRIKNNERILILTLTKKMSEDLASYLNEMKVKSRYLHSEIETIERAEILTEFRKGTFDCLIGINLLREGIDLPEASLLLLLDADKIGFLRSKRSLIQMIGRVARNKNGHVIMYADSISDAMKAAIKETLLNRSVQMEYNKKHNIIPQTIIKEQKPILIRRAEKKKIKKEVDSKANILKIRKLYNLKNPEEEKKYIQALKEKMFKASEKLEFEEAALLRDEIERIYKKKRPKLR